MAETTTTILSEFIQSQIGKAADDEIAQHLFWPGAPCSKWIKTRDITSEAAKACTFPKYAALTAYDLTEGTDYSTLQELDPTSATITVTEHGVQSLVTELAWNSIGSPNGKAAFAADLARNHIKAIMTKYDVDIMSLFDNLTAGFTNTGVNLTNADILYTVDLAAKANMPTPWVGILHPQQWADLVNEAGSPLANFGVSGTVGQEFYGQYFVGHFYNVDWFVSSNVPTANAAADRGGALLSAEALGAVWKLFPDTRYEHNQSYRGDEVLTVAQYAVGQLDGGMGMYIISDA